MQKLATAETRGGASTAGMMGAAAACPRGGALAAGLLLWAASVGGVRCGGRACNGGATSRYGME